jgi:hypothetical protein
MGTPSTGDEERGQAVSNGAGEVEHRIAAVQGENGELSEIVTRVEPDSKERIVQSTPLPEATDRENPEDPVPGTIPRTSEGALIPKP